MSIGHTKIFETISSMHRAQSHQNASLVLPRGYLLLVFDSHDCGKHTTAIRAQETNHDIRCVCLRCFEEISSKILVCSSPKAMRKMLQLIFIVSQNLKSKDVTVFTQFAIYQSQSFKITQYMVICSPNSPNLKQLSKGHLNYL